MHTDIGKLLDDGRAGKRQALREEHLD